MTPIELNTDALEELLSIAQNLPEPVEPIYQTKNVTPSASSQTITPDAGYDALSSVTVAGDADLVASNIKKDAEIFGVTGTYEGSWPPSTITAGNTPVIYCSTGAGQTTRTSMTKLLSITIPRDGTYKFRWVMANWANLGQAGNFRTQLYKGSATISGHGQHSFTSATYYTSEVIEETVTNCKVGEVYSVYGKHHSSTTSQPLIVFDFMAFINGDNGFQKNN